MVSAGVHGFPPFLCEDLVPRSLLRQKLHTTSFLMPNNTEPYLSKRSSFLPSCHTHFPFSTPVEFYIKSRACAVVVISTFESDAVYIHVLSKYVRDHFNPTVISNITIIFGGVRA